MWSCAFKYRVGRIFRSCDKLVCKCVCISTSSIKSRLKEEQLAERVARERNFKTQDLAYCAGCLAQEWKHDPCQGHAPPQEAAERAEAQFGMHNTDH